MTAPDAPRGWPACACQMLSLGNMEMRVCRFKESLKAGAGCETVNGFHDRLFSLHAARRLTDRDSAALHIHPAPHLPYQPRDDTLCGVQSIAMTHRPKYTAVAREEEQQGRSHLSAGSPRSLRLAMSTQEKASLISKKSICLMSSLACRSALGTARLGAVVNRSGSRSASPKPRTQANTWHARDCAFPNSDGTPFWVIRKAQDTALGDL